MKGEVIVGQVRKKLGNVVFVGDGEDAGERVIACSMRGRLKLEDTGERSLACVGDRVRVEMTGEGVGVIEKILERKTLLSRTWVLNPELADPIVANAGLLVIVVSVNPVVKTGIIDRYLVGGLAGGLEPVIVLNKIDLKKTERESGKLDVYRRIGYKVLMTSAIRADCLQGLMKILKGRMSVLSGHSGVGKSTLLNRMFGFDIRVRAVAPKTLKGRHTTSHAEMYAHPEGGWMVDTPGIRSFGVAGVHSTDLVQYFPEIESAARHCKFRDCRHVPSQRGCAVIPSAKSGEISPTRFESYKKLKAELESLEVY